MKKRILHFSDLHISGSPEEVGVAESMAEAIRWAVNSDGQKVDVIAITGDLFNSSEVDPGKAVDAFHSWYSKITGALNEPWVRTFVVPGNHDVRRMGVLHSRHPTELISSLAKNLQATHPHVHIHGAREPSYFLVEHVRREEHGLPAEMLLLDSTHLAQGMLSAGGVVRPDDLLEAVAVLPPHEVLLVLLHHHFVPTQITDESLLTYPGRPVLTRGLRWLLRNILSNADHEELSMTASGAGTALGLLHALDRPVLVLHGHKHYPMVRLLRGVQEGQGDVLLASAGSAGTAEPWRPSKHSQDAIWPSFNIVDFDGEDLVLQTVAYPSVKRERESVARRLLLHARRSLGQGESRSAWDIVKPGDRHAPSGQGPSLMLHKAVFQLEDAQPGAPRWSTLVERSAEPAGGLVQPYEEVLDGPSGSLVDRLEGLKEHPIDENRTGPKGWSTKIVFEGRAPHRYRFLDGLMGTFEEAKKCYGKATSPYEWVDLFNRYQCKEAVLVLRGYPITMRPPFGSVVDLTTGLETSVPVVWEGEDIVLRVRNEAGTEIGCAPRSLLRIWWPLT